MLLQDLQAYLRESGTVSLAALEVRFGMAPAALRDALARLERKGRVRRLAPTACGGCTSGCAQCPLELYQWIPGN